LPGVARRRKRDRECRTTVPIGSWALPVNRQRHAFNEVIRLGTVEHEAD
jgi:hypothetical protein